MRALPVGEEERGWRPPQRRVVASGRCAVEVPEVPLFIVRYAVRKQAGVPVTV
jgi:hypothetical protein